MRFYRFAQVANRYTYGLKRLAEFNQNAASREIQNNNHMLTDINGGKKTGFEPYMQNDKIMFNHKWFLFIIEYEKTL